jgi:hypothetical protein
MLDFWPILADRPTGGSVRFSDLCITLDTFSDGIVHFSGVWPPSRVFRHRRSRIPFYLGFETAILSPLPRGDVRLLAIRADSGCREGGSLSTLPVTIGLMMRRWCPRRDLNPAKIAKNLENFHPNVAGNGPIRRSLYTGAQTRARRVRASTPAVIARRSRFSLTRLPQAKLRSWSARLLS